MTESTLTIPAALYQTPRCPVCAVILTYDKHWACLYCGIAWPDGPTSEGALVLPGPRCGNKLEPFNAGLARQPVFQGSVYWCLRPAGHTTSTYPGDLCAGLLIAGSDRITRTRTWRAETARAAR